MNWREMTVEQRVAAIKAGVLADKSARTIGNELGVNRNVIIGWVGRNKDKVQLRNTKREGGSRRKPVLKFDPFSGRQRATRTYDYSTLTGMARPTLRKVAREPVEATSATAVVILPPKPTSAPVLFRARRFGLECSYIEGDPKSALATACGAEVVPGTHWCAWHRRIVFDRRAA